MSRRAKDENLLPVVVLSDVNSKYVRFEAALIEMSSGLVAQDPSGLMRKPPLKRPAHASHGYLHAVWELQANESRGFSGLDL